MSAYPEKKSILLVEDEVLIAMNEKQELEDCGYRVFHVTGGEKAVSTILEEDERFDLILMDIDLGDGMDGTQAAERILQHRDIPVVFLSSHAEREIVEKTEKITSYGYVVKNTGIVVLDASLKMAFRLHAAKTSLQTHENELIIANRKLLEANRILEESEKQLLQREEKLRESEHNLKDVFNTVAEGLAYTTLTGNVLAVNKALTSLIGVQEEDLVGKNILHLSKTLLSSHNVARALPSLKMLISGQPMEPFEVEYNDKVLGISAMINPESKRLTGVLSDITERQRAEDALRESEKKFRVAFKISPDSVNINRLNDGLYIDINEGFTNITGYSEADIMGKTSLEIDIWANPEDRKRLVDALKKEGKVTNFEAPFRMKNGSVRNGLMSASLIEVGGVPHILSVTRDITERKEAEKEIRKQLLEKEILLKEVHHRIKNNISSIKSFLNLQARSTENLEARGIIGDAVSRVESMLQIYNKLLVTDNYQEVSVKDYLEDLVSSICSVFPENEQIAITMKIDDFRLGQKQVFPLGIIVNELITNSMKHAFPEGGLGRISISLKRIRRNSTLIVQDNGCGLPEPYDSETMAGFGLRLVDLLARQLGGTVTMENKNGTKSTVVMEIGGYRDTGIKGKG